MNSPVTLFIAHPEELLLAGFEAIARAHGLDVVGSASDGEGTLSGLRATRPEVALVDCTLPPQGGFGVARAVAEECPGTRVVMLSPTGDENHLARAHAARAVHCVDYRCPGDRLAEVVRRAAAGRTVTAPDPYAVVIAKLAASTATPADAHLSPRERQVLRHVAHGLDNDEIAAALAIGIETVKTHVHKLLAKLGMRDRTQAAVWAVQQRIV